MKISLEFEVIHEFETSEEVISFMAKNDIGLDLDYIKYYYLIINKYHEVIKSSGEAMCFFDAKNDNFPNHEGNLMLIRAVRYLDNREEDGDFK
ncbi:hypothetical protein CMU94_02260 [Elizabethkingia anophelis]|nr:hypothetical protein [Elizabethkingia anophelis]